MSPLRKAAEDLAFLIADRVCQLEPHVIGTGLAFQLGPQLGSAQTNLVILFNDKCGIILAVGSRAECFLGGRNSLSQRIAKHAGLFILLVVSKIGLALGQNGSGLTLRSVEL